MTAFKPFRRQAWAFVFAVELYPQPDLFQTPLQTYWIRSGQICAIFCFWIEVAVRFRFSLNYDKESKPKLGKKTK